MSKSVPPLPTNLKHHPLYAIYYEPFDLYAPDTDTKYISIGQSSWDDRCLSVKIWRHTGTQWSRQAEEVPAARMIDAVIVLAYYLRLREFSGQGVQPVPKGTFVGQTNDVWPILPAGMSDLSLDLDLPWLEKRLSVLKQVLDNLGF